MAFPNNILLFLCSALLLSACDGGASDGNNDGIYTLPFETTPANSSTTTLGAREIAILEKIKQRSTEDGAFYQFDELNPVFVKDGDTMKVSFTFVDPNTFGGSPIVEYSLTQNVITSIVYTQ